jgi:hypothetical protein
MVDHIYAAPSLEFTVELLTEDAPDGLFKEMHE